MSVQQAIECRNVLNDKLKRLETRLGWFSDKVAAVEKQIQDVDKNLCEEIRAYKDGTEFIANDNERFVIVSAEVNWIENNPPIVTYVINGRATVQTISEEALKKKIEEGKLKFKTKEDFIIRKSVSFKQVDFIKNESDRSYYYGITSRGIMIVFSTWNYSKEVVGTGRYSLRMHYGSWRLTKERSPEERKTSYMRRGRFNSLLSSIQIEKVCRTKEDAVEFLL